MAKRRVIVVGGGLAGLAASMKLAELDVDVGLMSLTQVKSKKKGMARATGGNILCESMKNEMSSFFHLVYSKRVSAYPAITPNMTVMMELESATTMLFLM